MAKLKRDERLCPLCAEAIKASAIRCRFCQSDIDPIVEAEVSSSLDPKAKKPAAKTKSDSPDESTSEADQLKAPAVAEDLGESRAPWHKNLTVVLAVLVALAGAGVGTLWWQAEQSSAASAPNGTLVGDDARNEVLISAADLAQRTLSYDYRTLANDMEVAQARMTPEFLKEYQSTMAQVRDNTTTNRIVLQAVAVSSAIIKATERDAEVLVFLNQNTTAGKGKKQNQQLTRNSLVITLERDGGDWAIAGLTALG